MPGRLGQITSEESRERDRYFEPVYREVHSWWNHLSQGGVDIRVHRSRQMDYALSEPARLYAALRVLPKAPLIEVKELAASLRPGARNREAIPWSWRLKPNGKHRRPVCDLPPVLKANHYIIKDLLFSRGQAPAHLFDVRGKGTTAAARQVIKALEEGYDWCWTGDIRDCFQRVSSSALRPLLPLPSSLVRHCLDPRELNISAGPSLTNQRARDPYVADVARRHGPRGLLTGSPASNAVLSVLLADMDHAVSPLDCVICVFADNIFLAARTEEHVLQAVSMVRDYLVAHPGGSFRLHKEVSSGPNQAFEFVGYQFNRRGGQIELEPTFASYERMYGAFADAEDLDIKREDGLATEVEGKLRSYRSAYPLWAGGTDALSSVRHQSTVTVAHLASVAANLKQLQERYGKGNRDARHDLACQAP